MRFAYPWMLVLVVLVPFAGFCWSLMKARREKALARISLKVPKVPFAGLQTFSILVGLALALFAAARPQWGKSLEKRVSMSRNVVVAIDVSLSMLAEDVFPNRLKRAKADVADLIDALGNDRCALVAFRKTAKALFPLTTDRAHLHNALEAMDENSAPRGETDLGSAIRESLRVIGKIHADPETGEPVRDWRDDHSAIIIISDGGDLKGDAVKCAEYAKSRGVPVFTVGIGDPVKGATIPNPDGKGYVQYKGKNVVVKLESAALEAIANASGGRYVELATAGTAETTLGAIYRRFLRQVASREQNEQAEKLGERYNWFLVPAIALLLLGAGLSRGRFAGKKSRERFVAHDMKGETRWKTK